MTGMKHMPVMMAFSAFSTLLDEKSDVGKASVLQAKPRAYQNVGGGTRDKNAEVGHPVTLHETLYNYKKFIITYNMI